jgi:hypothetical protein
MAYTDSDTRIQFYYGRSPLRTALEERTRHEQTTSEIAKRDLERYYDALRRALQAFSEPEASLIVDACKAWLVEPHSAPLLWAEVDDAIRGDGLAVKWGVDGSALVARLRALTPFEALAVCDAAERFWRHPEIPTEENLRRVALVR